MQAGFALVETGFCRAKHAAHVVSTNFAIFGLGFVAYYCVGYAFMFGGYSFPGVFGYDSALGGAAVGSGNHVLLWHGGFFLHGGAYDVGVMAFFLYMVAFMDTTATIPTGAMAERWKWNSFCSGACSAAPSTTRCSARGRGAAAGWPSSAPVPTWATATSTSPVRASST